MHADLRTPAVHRAREGSWRWDSRSRTSLHGALWHPQVLGPRVPSEFRTRVSHSIALATAVAVWTLQLRDLALLTVISLHVGCTGLTSIPSSNRSNDVTTGSTGRSPSTYVRHAECWATLRHAAHQHVLVRYSSIDRTLREALCQLARSDRSLHVWSQPPQWHLAQCSSPRESGLSSSRCTDSVAVVPPGHCLLFGGAAAGPQNGCWNATCKFFLD